MPLTPRQRRKLREVISEAQMTRASTMDMTEVRKAQEREDRARRILRREGMEAVNVPFSETNPTPTFAVALRPYVPPSVFEEIQPEAETVEPETVPDWREETMSELRHVGFFRKDVPPTAPFVEMEPVGFLRQHSERHNNPAHHVGACDEACRRGLRIHAHRARRGRG